MTRPIVIPLDGSEQALAALPIAKRLAELEGGPLHLVHVAREVSPPAEVLARIGISRADLRDTVLDTKAGDSAEGILEAADELHAALVVMCTHAAGDAAVGRTALAVLKGAACPIVFVRPERRLAPWALRRILLPHDGTPVTSAAILPAAELTQRSAAELDVLHVASPGAPIPAESGSLPAPRYLDQPQHEWPAWVDEFVERLSCCCPLESLSVRMWLAPGRPAEEVLRVAGERGSDLIVLAWRGSWEGQHAGIIKAVLDRSPAPAMIVRAGAQS